jgi:AcrR family transcriptional regulator
MPPSPKDRCAPLRADAQRNYDALVETADAEFRARGAEVPLEEIARRAGVGIGTLYRHFPTRDDLLAKVLDKSTSVMVQRGRELMKGTSPGEDLIQWIRELAEYTATYRGLTTALANSYVAANGSQLCSSCKLISAVGEDLLKRAQAAGEIRGDAQVVEIILSAHSAAWIGEQTQDPSAVRRLLGILFDGLRVTRPPTASAPAAAPTAAAPVAAAMATASTAPPARKAKARRASS